LSHITRTIHYFERSPAIAIAESIAIYLNKTKPTIKTFVMQPTIEPFPVGEKGGTSLWNNVKQ